MFIVLTEISQDDAGERMLTPVKTSIRCICGYFTRNGQTVVVLDKNMLEQPSVLVTESEADIDAMLGAVVDGGAVIGDSEAAAIWLSTQEPAPAETEQQ